METQNTLDSQDLPKQLSDAAWNSILPFLRDCRNVYVGNPETCRHFLSAVLWIAKEGATWRALPKVYGNWNAIYRRFSRWCDVGVSQALHEHFHDAGAISGILIKFAFTIFRVLGISFTVAFAICFEFHFMVRVVYLSARLCLLFNIC